MIKEIGLSLGGGSARGFCHLGVFRFLEENSIKIKEISGTSMGAIIASSIAVGFSYDEIIEKIKKINFLKLIDINLKTGILSGKKILNVLEDIFGGINIEDCKIPLSIVALNINTGEKEVFKKGKIAYAVRSSISLPGIISPFNFDGNLYLDGGFVSNLPIGELSSNNIIAVSASPKPNRTISTSSKIFGIEKQKSFFGFNYNIIRKTIEIVISENEKFSIEMAKEQKKNLMLLRPDFGSIKNFDFSKYTEIDLIGYKEAKEKLPKYLGLDSSQIDFPKKNRFLIFFKNLKKYPKF